MNNYFSKLAANLSSKENNESNLTTLLQNLPDEKYNQSYGFCPPPRPTASTHSLPPIIMEQLNLKICQHFAGKNFFLHLWGDKLLWGELKLYGGE